MAARAFAYLGAILVPAFAVGVLVPIATKEWYPDTWIASAGLLFAAAWIPLSVWPMVVATERGAREGAPGEGIISGDLLTIQWGEDTRALELSKSSVAIGFGVPGAGGDMGSLQLLIDDGMPGPKGRSGAARIVVALPFSSRAWLRRRDLQVRPSLRPSGLPVLGWDREVEVFRGRILDRAASIELPST